MGGDFLNSGTFTANSGTVIFNGLTIQQISGNITFKHLTVNNLSGVSISSGPVNVDGTLTLLSGTVTTNGNLNINFTNYGNIAGTGVGSISGNVTYLRTIGAGWHYISNPLGTGTLEHFNDDMSYITSGLARYYWYNEAVINTSINVGWTAITSPSYSLADMRGICPYFSGAVTLDATGVYNHDASYSSFPLGYTSSGVDASDGWNLIGNPYPSTLDWESATGWTKTNINNAIYYWDPVTELNKSFISGAGTNQATQYIPAMQAVLVKALPGGGSLSVNKNARSTTSQAFYKKAFDQELLKLRVNSGSYSDETVVRFIEDATAAFDPEYDAYKFLNSAPNASLYTKTGKDVYSINSLPVVSEDVILPLHFVAGFNAVYSLEIEIPVGFNPEIEVLLEDQQNGELVNLRYQSSYSFSSSKTDASNRFRLIFKKPTITSTTANTDGKQLRVYNTGEKVFLDLGDFSGSDVQVSLINSMGEVLKSDEIQASSAPVLFVEKGLVETGVFLVKMVSGKSILVQQVFITK